MAAGLPDFRDLGGLPSAGGSMPISRPDPSAIAKGAAALAQGGVNLGKGITELGEGIGQLAIDKQRYEYATAHADFLAKKIDLDASVAHDQDYATLPQRYGDEVTRVQTDVARSISSPAMRSRFMQATAVQVAEGNAKASQHAFTLEGNATVAGVQQGGDDLINKAVTLPVDSPDRINAVKAQSERIAALRGRGFITPEQELQERQRWADKYAIADGVERSKLDPQGVINDLRAAPSSPEQITNRFVQLEGRSKNARSSATGVGQFIDSTWLDVVKRNRPDLAQGRSDAELLALRADDKLAWQMTDAYRRENEASLKAQGLPATPGQQYLAHFLGPGAAAAVLKANPRMPVDQALTAAVGPDMAKKMVDANPTILRGQLAGSVAEWADTKMGGVGPGGGHLYDILRPDQRAMLLSHAEGQLDKQHTNNTVAFRSSVADDVAEASRTGAASAPKSQADFVAAYGIEHGPALYNDYRADLQLGADKLRLSTMAPGDIDALVKSYEPKQGSEGYARAVKRIEDLEAAAQAEGVRRLSPSIKSDLAEATRTGTVTKPKTQADFDLAFGKDKGAEAFAAYTEALDTANEGRSLSSATPSQIQGTIAAHAPVPGADYDKQARRQDGMIKVAQGLYKERTDDPAQYGVDHLPAVQESWQALQGTMNDATATPQVRAAFARDYATKQVMEQQRLGIDRDDIRIVPQAYTDAMADRMARAAGDDDPQKRVALIGQIQREAQMWGENWPAVMRQVAEKTQPVVRAIAAGADPGAMTRLLSLKKDETAKTIIGEQNDTKLADVTREVNNAMAPFRSTLVGRQMDRDFPGYQDLAIKLAALHARDGDAAGDAATKAFNELIGNRYEFRDSWRLPKSAGVPADEVQAGTRAARAELQRSAVAGATDNLAAAKRDLNLSPQEEALYRRHLTNLTGPGGVDNPDGSRSSLFALTAGIGDRTYTLPTVRDGKILPFDEAIASAKAEGLDNFPSYALGSHAEERYARMHDYMERDTARYFEARRNPLANIRPATDDMGLGSGNVGDSLDKFARDGKFVTSPDNSGLNLVYGDKFVRTNDGRPLFLSWADLAARSKVAPAEMPASASTVGVQ